jgi:hypothetical protein
MGCFHDSDECVGWRGLCGISAPNVLFWLHYFSGEFGDRTLQTDYIDLTEKMLSDGLTDRGTILEGLMARD